MFGLGLGNTLVIKSALSAGGFSFTDSDAEAYYDALVTANSGDIDSSTLYGIELDAFKEAIDVFVLGMKTDSLWAKMTRFYPFAGGTDVTHAINAINAASELLYVGSPTHNGTGMILNGSSQYGNMNNSPIADVTGTHDWSIGVWIKATNSKMTMGCRDSAGNGCAIRWRSAQTLISYTNALSMITTAPTVFDKNLILTRRSNIDSEIYSDGSPYYTETGTTNINFPSVRPTIIGAWLNGATPLDYTAGPTVASFIGDNLTDTQASNLSTRIKTFNTSLGR